MYSEQIQAFLSFLRYCQQDYKIAVAEEKEANDETQDILHRVEFQENEGHELGDPELFCLFKTLRSVQVNRRKAKNRERQLQPIVEWVDQNRKTINDLDRLLGAVRKAERSMEGRVYIPRTDIVNQVLEQMNATQSDAQKNNIRQPGGIEGGRR